MKTAGSQPTAPFRIAVAGAGAIGRVHIDLIEADRRCCLAAIADPSSAAAAKAAQLGVPHFGDLERMLEVAEPHGVIIATPNASHVDNALLCIARGIPVLVEKPVSDTREQAERLAQATATSGVPVLVGHHRRHNPIIQSARDIVASGTLGRLVAVTGMCLLYKPQSYFEAAWHREVGAGPILINLIHDIDNLRFICGEIESVRAVKSSAVRVFAVEDSAALLLRFANGAIATLIGSDTTPAPWSWEMNAGENPAYPRQNLDCYRFAGTEGSLSLPDLSIWRYAGERDWMKPMLRHSVPVDHTNPLIRQLEHFCDIIAGRAEPLVTPSDAARTLGVAIAAHRAAETGYGQSCPTTSREDPQ